MGLSKWRITSIGAAQIAENQDTITLTNGPTAAGVYSDAQISDYNDAAFQWRPPVRLHITAQASSLALRGTAGFGFWNQPIMPGQYRLRLPQAIWFFYGSAPNNIHLAQGIPGAGWKAATINARNWRFLALLPTAPIGFLLMRIPALYQRLWPIGQRALQVSEALLPPDMLSQWHTYTLDWLPDGAIFRIDGQTVHQAEFSPSGPLGFVAWVDNQYAIVTPQGHFSGGLLALDTGQSLALRNIRIERL